MLGPTCCYWVQITDREMGRRYLFLGVLTDRLIEIVLNFHGELTPGALKNWVERGELSLLWSVSVASYQIAISQAVTLTLGSLHLSCLLLAPEDHPQGMPWRPSESPQPWSARESLWGRLGDLLGRVPSGAVNLAPREKCPCSLGDRGHLWRDKVESRDSGSRQTWFRFPFGSWFLARWRSSPSRPSLLRPKTPKTTQQACRDDNPGRPAGTTRQ